MDKTKALEVKTEVFEGPLDLLLNLISKHEIDIYEISIADITREYLEHLKQMQELDLDITSEFLVLASILLEIKSRSLIPDEQPEVFDELTPEQVRRELVKKLINYRKFKNCSIFLGSMIEEGAGFHPRESELEERFLQLMPDFTDEIEANCLVEMMVRIIQRHWAVQINTEYIRPIPFSIEDQIELINEELALKERLSFKELTKSFSKMKKVVTFLALLEMFKKGGVDINQAETFGDIEIKL